MNGSSKRIAAVWAVALISWSLSAFMFTGYTMATQPQPQTQLQRATPDNYSAYLSTQLRVGGYFEQCPNGLWAVVRYRIDADGKLLEAGIVDTNGTCRQARYILEGVRIHAPFRPLPEGTKSLTVTELFWSEGDTMPAGSLAEKLRTDGDDGRVLDFEY